MSGEDLWRDQQADTRARQERVMGAYGRLFRDKAVEGDAAIVLEDLRAFCYVDRDMFTPEAPTLMANLLGRYRVWQRIEGLRKGDERGFEPGGYSHPAIDAAVRRRASPGRSLPGGPAVTEG